MHDDFGLGRSIAGGLNGHHISRIGYAQICNAGASVEGEITDEFVSPGDAIAVIYFGIGIVVVGLRVHTSGDGVGLIFFTTLETKHGADEDEHA